MKKSLFSCCVAIGFLAFVSGCGVIVGLYKVEQPATLVLVNNVAAIVAPDTVNRNVAFDVKFTSFENKCTDSPREEVLVADDSISIHSFVTRQPQCGGDALQLLPHTAQVRVSTPGTYHIHLHGQKSNASGDVVLSRDVVVR